MEDILTTLSSLSMTDIFFLVLGLAIVIWLIKKIVKIGLIAAAIYFAIVMYKMFM